MQSTLPCLFSFTKPLGYVYADYMGQLFLSLFRTSTVYCYTKVCFAELQGQLLANGAHSQQCFPGEQEIQDFFSGIPGVLGLSHYTVLTIEDHNPGFLCVYLFA